MTETALGAQRVDERIERQICGSLAARIMNPRRPVPPPIGRELLDDPDAIIQDLARFNERDKQQGFGLSRQLGEMLGADLFHMLAAGDGHRMEELLRQIFKGNLMTMLDLLSTAQRTQVA